MTKALVPVGIVIVEALPPVLLGLATVPMWLQPLLPEQMILAVGGRSFHVNWVLFGTSLVLLVLGGVLSWRRRKSIHTVEQENAELQSKLLAAQQTIDNHHRDVVDAVSVLAQSLMEEFYDATTRANKDNKRRYTRLTVYCRDRKNRVFVPISRKSANPTLQTMGRKQYPDGQGIIGRAWKEGFAVERDLPDERVQWDAENVEKWGFTEAETRQLKMHPRSMAAVRLDSGADAVGIIVVESEKPHGVDARTVDLLQASVYSDDMAAMIRLLWSHGITVMRERHGPEWAMIQSIPESPGRSE